MTGEVEDDCCQQLPALKNHVPPSPLSSPSEIFFKDTCYLALVSTPQVIHPSRTVLGQGSKSLKIPFQGEGSEKRKEVGVGNMASRRQTLKISYVITFKMG